MKKTMAGILAGVMIVSGAQAASAAEDWLTYGSGDATIKYSTYTGSVKRATDNNSTQDHAPAVTVKTFSVSVPTEINGTTIKGVEKRGFFDFDELKAIELPNTLETIGDMAFMGADNLGKITIPSKVKVISKAAFKSCDSLSDVKFGSGVKTVGEQSFYGCKSLTSISLNSGCEEIGTSAFELCSGLKSVVLPTSIKTIAGSAFKDCKSLSSITIPSSVTRIEANTFAGCKSLKSVQINGKLTVIDKNAFKDCTELTDVYIPDSCKKIEDNAFDGAKKVVIHCSNGSYAQSFADSKKISVSTGKATAVQTDVPDTITVLLDGRELSFNGVEPQIVNGRTMLPMRAIFEELGCVMDWNGDTKTVTASKGVTNITLTVNSKRAKVNGKTIELDAAPMISNGSTLVPVRFISESLGLEVRWDQSTRTVNLISKK